MLHTTLTIDIRLGSHHPLATQMRSSSEQTSPRHLIFECSIREQLGPRLRRGFLVARLRVPIALDYFDVLPM